MSIVSLITSILAVEIEDNMNEDHKNKEYIITLFEISVGCTFFACISLVLERILFFSFQKYKMIRSTPENIFNTGEYKKLIIEIALFFV